MPIKKKIVIGNWKMNPATPERANSLFSGVKKRASYAREVLTVVCPPAHLLPVISRGYSGKKVKFGAQDVSINEGTGSHTGEISAQMLASAGADYAIIGHSERRAAGEDNKIVAHKAMRAAEAGLSIILCVGEQSRDSAGQYLKKVRQQIISVIQTLTHVQTKHLLIAYEPIWAIGGSSGDAMDSHELHQITLYIRKVLLGTLPEDTARSIPIIYGGSVERSNAADLLEGTEIDGFLVGHASLEANHFAEIIDAANMSEQ